MAKERLGAFIDAVLAIVITILVLNLKEPSALTFAGFWAIKESIFAYAISFFWIGIVWIMQITGWSKFYQIDRPCLLWALLMLFFASFFPYITEIAADHFYDLAAEVVYGLDALGITLCNMGLTHAINRANDERIFGLLFTLPNRVVYIDLSIKALGFIVAIAFWPPAIIFSILINILFRLFYLISNREKLGPKPASHS